MAKKRMIFLAIAVFMRFYPVVFFAKVNRQRGWLS